MLAEVGQAQRFRVHDEDAEDPMTLGQWADRGSLGIVDANGDELDEPSARLIEDAERAIPRIDQIGRNLDDPAKYLLEVELGADRDDRVQETTKLPWSRETLHPSERTDWI
jgi:hypothetical protein